MLETADEADTVLAAVAEEGGESDGMAELEADSVCADDGEAFAVIDDCADPDAGAVPAALLVPPTVRETVLDRDDEGDGDKDDCSLSLGDNVGKPVDDAVGHGAKVREPVGIDGFAVMLEDSVEAIVPETDAEFVVVSDTDSVAESIADCDGREEDDGAPDSDVKEVTDADDDASADTEAELVLLAQKLAEPVGAELLENSDDAVPLPVEAALADAFSLKALDVVTLTEAVGGALDVGRPVSETDIVDEELAADDVLACADIDVLSVALRLKSDETDA